LPEPILKEHEDILSPARLGDLARRLAAQEISRDGGSGVSHLQQLKVLEALLMRARSHFASQADKKIEVPSGAEWLLDNYYLVQQVVRQVRQDLPEGFYRQLPALLDEPYAGLPRIYVLASELTSRREIHLDRNAVRHFVADFQTVATLTIGELWALPALLRLAILDRLGREVAGLLGVPHLSGETADENARRGDGTELSAIAGCILDLRAIELQDWKVMFEDLSRVEQILRKDPAEVYTRMDFETRDRYRKVIEDLARATDTPEEVVAQQAIDLIIHSEGLGVGGPQFESSEPSKPGLDPATTEPGLHTSADLQGFLAGDGKAEPSTLFADRKGHVGYFLLDRGREVLEGRMGYSPAPGVRLRRWFTAHALPFYLGSIFFLTLTGLGALATLTVAWGGSLPLAALAVLISGVPAVSVAVGLVHSLVPRLVSPHLLPKMDFQDGVPRECTTLVAIPALLIDSAQVQSLLRQLEQHYLSTDDEQILFALLTDFGDAPHEQMLGDEALLARTRAGIRQLNQKHGEGRRTPFHLLQRKREWNPSEGVWMGWERKRGKLADLSDWLTGSATSSYELADPDVPLPPVRYVITLDTDSLLIRGGASRLIATPIR